MTTNYNNVVLGRIGDPIEEYNTTANFPAVGNTSILYVANNTGQIYKWDGAFYYETGPQGANTGSHSDQHKTNSTDPIALVEYSVPSLTTDTNDLAHNNSDILYLDSDTNNRNLSGLVAPNFCCVKTLINISSTNTIIINNQSTNSIPANRIITSSGSDFNLLPLQKLTLLYSTVSSRWRSI